MNTKSLPFADELITDANGQITKVILTFEDYKRLIEHVEDEGLYQAMLNSIDEPSLSIQDALNQLNE